MLLFLIGGTKKGKVCYLILNKVKEFCNFFFCKISVKKHFSIQILVKYTKINEMVSKKLINFGQNKSKLISI